MHQGGSSRREGALGGVFKEGRCIRGGLQGGKVH